MRTPWVGMVVIASTGCLATPGVHPTLHPSAPGSGASGGIALGAFVQKGDDTTSANVGYGEGWVRLGPGGGLELRTTPQAAFVAYDVTVAQGETTMSLRPSFGMSVIRYDEVSTTMTDTNMVAVMHPGLSFVINSGSFYAAPRLGLSRSAVLEGDGEGETAYSFGGSVGVRLPSRMSLEISAFYSRDTDDPPDSVWTIVPSLGIAVGD